jgi:dipeptidase E
MKLLLGSSSNTNKFLTDLLDKKPDESRVVFVTTAAKPYGDNVPWMHADIESLKALGCNVELIDIQGMNEEGLREKLENCDVIFVSGGNTYFLLDQAVKSGFFKLAKELVEKGKIYAGTSAGSILATPTIDSAKDADDASVAPDLKDLTGLGFVDFCIIPHYDKKEYKAYWRTIIKEWDGKEKLYLLNDGEAILVDGATLRFVKA